MAMWVQINCLPDQLYRISRVTIEELLLVAESGFPQKILIIIR